MVFLMRKNTILCVSVLLSIALGLSILANAGFNGAAVSICTDNNTENALEGRA